MRKKLKMRSGSKSAKFAGGGRVSQGLRSPRASQNRVQEAERAMGPAPDETSDMPVAGMAGTGMGGVVGLLAPPAQMAPPRRRASARGRATSADDLNDREMPRILNERSLAAAQAGRNMYAKGGLINAKKGNPFAKAAPGDKMAPPFGGMAKPKKAKKGAS